MTDRYELASCGLVSIAISLLLVHFQVLLASLSLDYGVWHQDGYGSTADAGPLGSLVESSFE
jgi:hypothetical protein